MNKFLSTVVAATLLSTVAIVADGAYNDTITSNGPVWQGVSEDNNTIPAEGGSLLGADVNLTVTLNADAASDTHFTLNFVNGAIPDTASYTLCNNGLQAGTYLSYESKNDDGRVNAVILEFKPDDGNESLIAAGQVLNLVDGGDCSAKDTVTVYPDKGKCVTVFSNHGQNTSGTVAIPELNSVPSNVIVKYKEELQVSCSTPQCTINSGSVDFTTEALSSGINKRLDNSDIAPRITAGDYKCYTSGCEEATYGPCTTVISIKNNTDHNITAFNFTPSFDGVAPEGMTYLYDINESNVSGTFGTPIVVTGLDLNDSMETNITVTFIPDGTHTINPGTVSAVINGIKDEDSKLGDATLSTEVAKFVDSVPSDFTVTYMNPTFKTFAMITAKADTKLSATITDTTGKTAEADLGTLEAGKTTFVWADNSDHPDAPLTEAAKAKGLNNGWSVTFHVTAAVDVAAYMEANGGQRTLTILYPQYTNVVDDNE